MIISSAALEKYGQNRHRVLATKTCMTNETHHVIGFVHAMHPTACESL